MGFDVGTFDYTLAGNNPGRNVFGNADISAARAQGASNYQVRQLMQRANREGVGVAGISKDWVQRNAPRPEHNYSGSGYWGFGMKDVNDIGNLADVKKRRDWAVQNRLNIGAGVNEWISGEERKEWQAKQDELMQQMMIEQQQEMYGSQTGARNINNYSATGLQTPRPEGWDLNTGGTSAAFGRGKPKPKTAGSLAINSVTL